VRSEEPGTKSQALLLYNLTWPKRAPKGSWFRFLSYSLFADFRSHETVPLLTTNVKIADIVSLICKNIRRIRFNDELIVIGKYCLESAPHNARYSSHN